MLCKNRPLKPLYRGATKTELKGFPPEEVFNFRGPLQRHKLLFGWYSGRFLVEKRQLILMVPIKVHRTDLKSFKVYILHIFFPKNVKIRVEENALALVFAQLLPHFVIKVTRYCYHWNQQKILHLLSTKTKNRTFI